MALGAKAQDCPNGDFEIWASHAYGSPDSGWYTSNPKSISADDTLTVWSVTGHAGQAVHIQTAIIGTDTLQAYVINTNGDPSRGTGGVPYSQQPISITGYYRYNMVGNDSALMIIEFKKAGIVISATQFTFRNISGSISSFTAFSFPLNTVPVAPDSVIIGIASSNVQGTGLQSGSWLEVDELAFGGTGITQAIPGGSFDSWTSQSIDIPNGWQVATNGNGGSGVTKSTAHYSGSYSVQLTTQPGTGGGSGNTVEAGMITSGSMTQSSGPRGGLPYTRTTDTLSGYYMYTPAGTDSGSISINLMAAGVIIGGDNYHFTAASTWTYFEIPITASTTPDTLRIDIQSGSWYAVNPGSVLNIDYLQLNSQPLGINGPITIKNKVIAYPNPANDVLNINCGNATGGITVYIYDMMGKVIEQKSYDKAPSIVTFQVGHLPMGLYFYEVINDGKISRDKFLKW